MVKVRSLAVIFGVLFVSIISMLRVFGYDRDYFSYLRFYEKTYFGESSRFEPGFQFITNVFKAFMGPDSFTFYLFFIAFVSLVPKFLILKNSRNYILMMAIYVMLIMPLHEMTQIRISVACGVMFWALHISIDSNRSLLNRLMWVLLGVSFHYSSIILAPFILLPNWFNKRSLVWIIAVPLLLALAISSSMTMLVKLIPIIGFYLEQVTLGEELVINPYSSRNLIFLTLVAIGLFNLEHISDRMLPWFYVSVAGLALWYSFMWLPVFAHRFLEITVFSYLVWVPSLPFRIRIPCLVLLLILGVYFISRMVFLNPMFAASM
jgi:hypothetical protein